MEIVCNACGETVLARHEPRFEGFRKTGDAWICTTCGHVHDTLPAASAATGSSAVAARNHPRKTGLFSADDPPRTPSVFTDEDRPERPRIFGEDERRRSCGWCRHFVVNPFSQRCGRHNREVEATDLCGAFAPREP